MKLVYRGIAYNHIPLITEIIDGKVSDKFSGLDWRFHNLKKLPILKPCANLTYRGVTYQNCSKATSGEVSAKANIQERARFLMMNKEKVARKRAKSMLHRLAHEVGLV